MRGALLVVVLLATGCNLPPKSVTACAFSPLAHPTMTTEDVATENELHVQQTVEGASRGPK